MVLRCLVVLAILIAACGDAAKPAATHGTSPEPTTNRAPADAVVFGPEPRPEPTIAALMDDANRAYDRMELDRARELAQKVLINEPTNVRMLRMIVSIACLEGERDQAEQAYRKLPERDQIQMRTRCERYGISLEQK
jgi:predicted Zn-dependent protease